MCYYFSFASNTPLNDAEQIRGAIQEYQTQLIDSVKEDIKHLHEKVSSTTSPRFHY